MKIMKKVDGKRHYSEIDKDIYCSKEIPENVLLPSKLERMEMGYRC